MSSLYDVVAETSPAWQFARYGMPSGSSWMEEHRAEEEAGAHRRFRANEGVEVGINVSNGL